VLVSGLAKGPVHRFKKEDERYTWECITEQDNLGYFFQKLGMAVEQVVLMIDDQDECFGLGYVVLAKKEDVEKAIQYNGTTSRKLTGTKNGTLKIEGAKPAGDLDRQSSKELEEARRETEALERSVRLAEAKVRDIALRLEKTRQRHRDLSQLQHNETKRREELEQERAMQKAYEEAEENIRLVSEEIEAELRSEERSVQILEDLTTSVDKEQTQRHLGPVVVTIASDDVLPDSVFQDYQNVRTRHVKLPVKHGFIQYDIPVISPMKRAQTAPPEYARSVSDDEEGAETAPQEPLSPISTPWRQPSFDRGSSIGDLDRAASGGARKDLSRSFLEDKMDLEEATALDRQQAWEGAHEAALEAVMQDESSVPIT